MTLNSDESKSFLTQEVDSKLTSFLRRVVRQLSLPEAAIDDIRQQVLVRLSRLSDERVAEIQNSDAFLYAVARNEARRFWQNTKAERHLSLEDEEVHIPPAEEPSVHERLESALLLREIWNNLKPDERQIFQLIIIGYNDKEMALRLGITHNAARQRVSRLRAKLRERYEKDR